MHLLKQIVIVPLAVLSVSGISYSQNESFIDKNSISLNTTFYNFLNGGPTFQIKHINRPLAIFNSFGIKYLRRINKLNLWSISADYHGWLDYTPITELERGTYWSRKFLDIRGTFVRQMHQKKRHLIFGSVGLSTRIGNEEIFGSYTLISGDFGESFVLGKTLFDLGIGIGAKYRYHIGQNMHIRMGLNYTFYAITFDKKNENYSWDRGPTRHMLSLSLGLGLNYGKN